MLHSTITSVKENWRGRDFDVTDRQLCCTGNMKNIILKCRDMYYGANIGLHL